MCNCGTWARIPSQGTHDGKYPPPEHHPDCEDYKAERFVRVIHHGSSCTMEPHEVDGFIEDGSGGEYKFEDVFLTRYQFNQMHEFNGF